MLSSQKTRYNFPYFLFFALVFLVNPSIKNRKIVVILEKMSLQT